MIDGFHWTRVTAKQLRFLYQDVVEQQPAQQMTLLAAIADRRLAGGEQQQVTAAQPANADTGSVNQIPDVAA